MRRPIKAGEEETLSLISHQRIAFLLLLPAPPQYLAGQWLAPCSLSLYVARAR